jgi:uncharacterized RDD family membrane protein YckC
VSRLIRFNTPENVDVTYELAGIGSRFVGALVDHFVQICLMLATWAILSWIAGASMVVGFARNSMPLWLSAVLLVASFLIYFGYFVFFEVRWRGATPGKRLAGLRVVRDGGYPIDAYAAVIRNLVRIVDMMPPFYGAAIASVFMSDEYKRLGDWAAGTIVIKDRPPAHLGERGQGPPSPEVARFMETLPNLADVTTDEFLALRRFVERRHELTIRVQAHLAMRLTLPMIERLGIEVDIPVQWAYADLAEAIARRYVAERGLIG